VKSGIFGRSLPGMLPAMADGSVRRIGPQERVPGSPTPGMSREEALATGSIWAGVARTDAGMASGWHHHGGHESVIYVLTGKLKMESGPGGSEVVEAGPGDFLLVPANAVHRESNPTDEESQIVVFRSGTGPVVVNVEGPDAAP
jgi:uncharacterized RmlC-like cupin family protein